MSRWFVVVLVIAACSKQSDPGPSCARIADHMLQVMKTLPGHGDQALGDRKQMIAQCERRSYPREVRTCLVAANTLDDLAICQKAQPPPPRDNPVPPAASGSGGNAH